MLKINKKLFVVLLGFMLAQSPKMFASIKEKTQARLALLRQPLAKHIIKIRAHKFDLKRYFSSDVKYKDAVHAYMSSDPVYSKIVWEKVMNKIKEIDALRKSQEAENLKKQKLLDEKIRDIKEVVLAINWAFEKADEIATPESIAHFSPQVVDAKLNEAERARKRAEIFLSEYVKLLNPESSELVKNESSWGALFLNAASKVTDIALSPYTGALLAVSAAATAPASAPALIAGSVAKSAAKRLCVAAGGHVAARLSAAYLRPSANNEDFDADPATLPEAPTQLTEEQILALPDVPSFDMPTTTTET